MNRLLNEATVCQSEQLAALNEHAKKLEFNDKIAANE